MKGSIRSRDANDGAGIPPAPIGVYLTRTWLPSKQVTLRPSTWDSYRRNIELHVLPELGRVPIRHVRVEHLERLYAKLLDDGRANRAGGFDTKTVLEIHMALRRALTDATRRGIITRNPADLANAPKRRPLASAEQRRWNARTTQGVSRPRRRPRSNGQCLVQRPTKPHSTTAEGFRFDRWEPRQRSSCVQLGFRTRRSGSKGQAEFAGPTFPSDDGQSDGGYCQEMRAEAPNAFRSRVCRMMSDFRAARTLACADWSRS